MLGRAAFALALGVSVAGCGGTKPASVASIGTSTTPSATSEDTPSEQPSFTAYATCMSAHGVPTESPGGHGVMIENAGSAQLSAASAACRALLPGGGPPALTPAERAKRTQQLFVFSRCMRSHGVPNFPDPDSTGDLPLDKLGSLGSTHVYRAYTACRSLFPRTGPQIRLTPAP